MHCNSLARGWQVWCRQLSSQILHEQASSHQSIISTPASRHTAGHIRQHARSRCYATHATLPPEAAAALDMPPPSPPPASRPGARGNSASSSTTMGKRNESVAMDTPSSDFGIQSHDDPWELSVPESGSDVANLSARELEALDGEFEDYIASNRSLSLSTSTSDTPASAPVLSYRPAAANAAVLPDTKLSFPKLRPFRNAQQHLLRAPLRASYKPQRALPIQSVSQVPFEEFRMQHRIKQYVPEYTWSGEAVENEDNGEVQPHHASLRSRYDWRLRTPWRTPGARQKQAYSNKIIFRKRLGPDTGKVVKTTELKDYLAKNRRLIDLERAEAETAALARLRKNASKAPQWDLVNSAEAESIESFAGLVAVRPRVRNSHKTATRPAPQSRAPAFEAASRAHAQTVEEDDPRLLPEDVDSETPDASHSVQYNFTWSKRSRFPSNPFHRGKVVFIWKCTFDSFLTEWIVPELQDQSLSLEQLSAIPARGWVSKQWADQIDVICLNFWPEVGAHYRLDIGYDGTAFDRAEIALLKLQLNTSAQRLANEASSKGPSRTAHDIQVQGTELQDLIIPSEAEQCDLHPRPELKSDVLMDNQYIASWAKRYSRPDPLRLDGDPDLQLNDTQLRAIATAVSNRLSLIQGPPGTGKTATIVAALKLLKEHFQIAAPILICAHTNVVVDMIVDKCASAGLVPLRFGKEHRISEHLRAYSIDEQVRLHPLQPTVQHWIEEEEKLQERKKEIQGLLLGKGTVLADMGTEAAKMPIEERHALQQEIERSEEGIKKAQLMSNKTLRTIHSDLISSSDVCLATCISGTTWEMQTADFPIVFIDEAGQCDEPTSLVPLMKGSRHVVLIGDHKQLPSVCSSDEARKEGLNRSLFERLKVQSSVPSIQLDIQYRMLPLISAFPNMQFYNGTIRDSPERIASSASATRPPLTFYDHDGLEACKGQSLRNTTEADMVIELLMQLQAERATPASGVTPQDVFANIGVISMYAAQVELLRRKAEEALGPEHGVEIHTVDGYQGRDKDTIIISTVRSNGSGTIGFLKDPRRLNVALTRARNHLYIFGNKTTLSTVFAWDRESHVPAQHMSWLVKNKLIRKV